jgi:ubiquinone biosynthesis protein
MKNQSESHCTAVQRVMVGTDRSETAEQAVQWATAFAERYEAELFVVQVIRPQNPASTKLGEAERTRAAAANKELAIHVQQLAGEHGHALVILDVNPAMAIVRAAEQEAIDVLIVGNVGMAGRKEFLLGNVPNRISHNARCTVIIVNTQSSSYLANDTMQAVISNAELPPIEPRLAARGGHIAVVMAKHGLKGLFGRGDEQTTTDRRRQQAKQLRAALEELGPTFSKLGQILSTRPDLLPAEYIEELAMLQDNVPPLAEQDVVMISERELGVPWEDVFESVDPTPLAAGTIGQIHRATLSNGDRVVIKVQRPTAREDIEQDLVLLEIFAEKVGERPALQKVIDMEAVFKQLSSSLRRELDFTQEASNIERMRGILRGFDRLDVPSLYRDLSTSRLLVMEEIQGIPIMKAPEGLARTQAARQLLESYYKQIMMEGFFHADPHPGNLMWWKERVYFLDFGMVGNLEDELREHLMLLLMSFWQEDAEFLTDITLLLSSNTDQSDLDVSKYQAEISEFMSKYRAASLAEMQVGPILQEMSEISLRHGIPLPATLALTGKALAQVQLATVQLDPTLDPFEVAGKFLTRSLLHSMRSKLNLKTLIYQSQKLKVRVSRTIDTFEQLTGARPGGQKLVVNFRANSLEYTVRRAGRQMVLGLIATASVFATGYTVVSTTVAGWVPIVFGVLTALCIAGLIINLVRSD